MSHTPPNFRPLVVRVTEFMEMGEMGTVKYKSTKLYCLRRGDLYVAWDGRTMTDKPHEGIRLSRTLCERKYPGYEILPFPKAYRQWYEARQAERGES